MIEYNIISNATGEGNGDNYNLFGGFSNTSKFSISTSDKNYLAASLNGKFLLETEPYKTTVGNISELNNTGDVYNNSGTAVLDQQTSGNASDVFYYSVRDFVTASRFYQSESHIEMVSGFAAELGPLTPLYDIYLNGQKLTLGGAYVLENDFSGDIPIINGFDWNDSDTSITGRLHGTLKKDNSTSYTGFYDLYGQGYFMKNQSSATLYGQDIINSCYKELYSGVSSSVETGLQFSPGNQKTGFYTFSST